jgi:hypothetical protein
MRIFGEYAFLEDSRYTSQAKNAATAILLSLLRFSSEFVARMSASEIRDPHVAMARPQGRSRPSSTGYGRA